MLEAQETRGLTRSDDISRLLPAEAALLARGRVVRGGPPFPWQPGIRGIQLSATSRQEASELCAQRTSYAAAPCATTCVY